jgi:hypothetical protein
MEAELFRDGVLVAGLTAFINRVIEGLDADSPDSAHRRNGDGLAAFGYAQVRAEVEKSLTGIGITAAQALPGRIAAANLDIENWLSDYAALVLDGPSGVPRHLRWTLAEEAPPDNSAPHELALWSFGHRLVGHPVRSTLDDVTPLHAAGWTDRDVIDVVLAAATIAMQRVLRALPKGNAP